jgi:glycosyltransferase involved in cell wall biosynthesis
MKIAIFHNLPSGGAKRALYGLVKGLINAGCFIDAYTLSTAEEEFWPLKDIVDNLTVLPVRRTLSGLVKSALKYVLPIREYKVSLADLEEAQKRLSAIIDKGGYDIVFVEQDRYTMSPFILKYLDTPHVYYCPQPRRSSEAILRILTESISSSLLKRMWRSYITPRLDRIDRENASYANIILTNSYFSRETILRVYGMNSFVSYLGVDVELFRPLKTERGPYVLSVGAISPAKGYDFIIKALTLIEEGIRPRLIIVGNWSWKPYENHIKKLAAGEGVNLEIKTIIDDLELVELYNKAQLCVYAPYLEPFGLVPLEAMACGTPVVAVREGGIRESVVHQESGLLTERDEQQFAEAIKQLLLDKNKHHFMSNRAVENNSEFLDIITCCAKVALPYGAHHPEKESS